MISIFRVGSLVGRLFTIVSILNVSNVPALVVMVSWPTTLERPDRFQMMPLLLLISSASDFQLALAQRRVHRSLLAHARCRQEGKSLPSTSNDASAPPVFF